MLLVGSLSSGGKLEVDHLGSYIWVLLTLFSEILFFPCVFTVDISFFGYYFLLCFNFNLLIGVNVQTGEEVAVKLVSVVFGLVIFLWIVGWYMIFKLSRNLFM